MDEKEKALQEIFDEGGRARRIKTAALICVTAAFVGTLAYFSIKSNLAGNLSPDQIAENRENFLKEFKADAAKVEKANPGFSFKGFSFVGSTFLIESNIANYSFNQGNAMVGPDFFIAKGSPEFAKSYCKGGVSIIDRPLGIDSVHYANYKDGAIQFTVVITKDACKGI